MCSITASLYAPASVRLGRAHRLQRQDCQRVRPGEGRGRGAPALGPVGVEPRVGAAVGDLLRQPSVGLVGRLDPVQQLAGAAQDVGAGVAPCFLTLIGDPSRRLATVPDLRAATTMNAAVRDMERFGRDYLALFASEIAGLDLYARQVASACRAAVDAPRDPQPSPLRVATMGLVSMTVIWTGRCRLGRPRAARPRQPRTPPRPPPRPCGRPAPGARRGRRRAP